jgi:Mrp family chromosome partitioning ATPase
VQVLRPAKTSQVSPLPLRDAGLGGFIALLLAAAAAWGFDARWERRSDPDRFAGPLGAGCLGRVPAPAADGSAYLRLPDQWQRVVSGVDASMREVNGRCLLVAASAVTGQASRCAASLALAAAADGRSVVVVDADYASRELSHLVGAETAAGLTELTERPSGLQTPTAGVQRSEPMVALLTPGRPVSNAAAFYRTGPFRTTLAAIGQRADLVVVVGPPVLATADTSVLADAVDAVLLVVAESATEGETRAVGTALAWSSGQLIGYVVEHPAQQQAPWWRPGRTARTHPPTGLAALADLVKPLRVADEDTRANSHNGIPASALRLTSLPPRDDKRSHA